MTSSTSSRTCDTVSYKDQELKAEIRDHVDGPRIYTTFGPIFWLTRTERFMYWIGLWTADDIDQRRLTRRLSGKGYLDC